MNAPLSESILATLSYFDIFSYPLTATELYHSLWQPPASVSYGETLTALIELEATKQLETAGGYYMLPGASQLVATREQAIKWIEKKLQIARRAARLVRFVPFVQAFFVCNTVASGTATPDSDIDVLIVAADGRLWVARLLATLILHLGRLRRHGRHVTNRICLSFYLTPASFNLSPIRIPEPDIYLVYWLQALIPLYDPTGVERTLVHANPWTKRYLTTSESGYLPTTRYRVSDSAWSRGVKKFFATAWRGRYGDNVERQAKALQQARMRQVSGNARTKNSVIISDTMLKFHETDKREYYQTLWKEKTDSMRQGEKTLL